MKKPAPAISAAFALLVLPFVNAAQAAPPLTEEGYRTVVIYWHEIDICVDAQMLPVETAAWGRAHIRRMLSTWSVDKARMDSVEQQILAQSGPAERKRCDRVAMEILTEKERLAMQAATAPPPPPQVIIQTPAPAPAPSYQQLGPTFTTCNRFFGQTNCTTY